MFILIFFLVMSISQFITNKMMGIDDTLEESYTYSNKDSLYIGLLFITGIVLEVITRLNIKPLRGFINDTYWIIVCVYGGAALLIMVVLSELRKREIQKKREDLIQVYEILQKLVDKKGEGLDFNNVPFELEYKYGQIQKIIVDVDPAAFGGGEKMLLPMVGQLNNFMNTFNWNYDLSHLNDRQIIFIGYDKPPTMARWPGSWLRHFRYMPLGLTGVGEIAYQPDSIPKNDYGRSQFVNDHGEIIDTDKSLPTQPQGLICGATGGGKSVTVQNAIIHSLEHRDKIAIALVDPKQVEFSNYKGMNGVVGVANNTQETVELLRISRQVMLKRNKDMAKLGIKNLTDYKPMKKSGKVYITGREYNEDDIIKIRENGVEREISAGDLVEYLKED